MSRFRRRAAPSFTPGAPVPPYQSYKDYVFHFGLNVEATSGTVANGQQVGSRGPREGKPYAPINGAALATKAKSNMMRVAEMVARAAVERWNPRRFFDAIPSAIHHGVDHASKLRSLRTHETHTDYGCPATAVASRWRAFQRELLARMQRKDDVIDTAAWAEWMIRFDIHPLGDGSGRLATATAAWIMLLSGQRIPTYGIADRSAFHDAMRLGLDGFTAFYRTYCIRPEMEAVTEHTPFDEAAVG
jgi:hypothetical protein